LRKTIFINLLSLDVKICEVMRIYLNLEGKGKGNGKVKGKVKENVKLPLYRPGQYLRAPDG